MKNTILVLITLVCISCSTVKTVYVPVEHTKVEYVNTNDSTYVHDSVYYSVNTRNDTVFEIKYKYKVIERYKTDTILKVDSIPSIKEVEKIIEVNKLNWWQQFLIRIGGLTLLLIVIYLGFKILKLLVKV